jgi:hypothetical protein
MDGKINEENTSREGVSHHRPGLTARLYFLISENVKQVYNHLKEADTIFIEKIKSMQAACINDPPKWTIIACIRM